MKRKITSFMLLLAMLVSIVAVLPVASFAEDTTFKGTDVTLTDGILLNFYVEADDALGIDNAQKVDGKYVVTVPVAAKKMGNDVVAEFKAGADVVGEHSYSVKQYAEGILASDDYDDATKALVSAMLNYGAAAQKYFNYNADELVGTPVTDTAALKAAKAPEVEVDDEAKIFIGASLILEGTMTLRFYFAGSVDSATVDGEDAIVNADSAEFCYVDVKVTPDNIDKAYTVVAGETTVKYSVLNYLQRNADNAALSEMVASIYAYGVAAEEYVKTPLDYLQDEDLLIYEYPIDKLEEVVATVAYNSGNDSIANYYVHNDGKTISYLVDITDNTFDSLSVELADSPYLRFAFLAEKPVLDQPVKYAEGYCTYKAAWTYDFTVDIPDDAKYFIMAKMDGSDDVTPKKMTFTKGTKVLENIQDETLDTYEFPIENLVFDHGVIDDCWWSKHTDHAFVSEGDCKVAIVDIRNCAFDYVSLTQDSSFKKELGWTFLTEIPQWKQVVSYATGYSDGFKWSSDNADKDGDVHTEKNIEIPEDANYLVLYYMESYYSAGDADKRYFPNSIIFHDAKK